MTQKGQQRVAVSLSRRCSGTSEHVTLWSEECSRQTKGLHLEADIGFWHWIEGGGRRSARKGAGVCFASDASAFQTHCLQLSHRFCLHISLLFFLHPHTSTSSLNPSSPLTTYPCIPPNASLLRPLHLRERPLTVFCLICFFMVHMNMGLRRVHLWTANALPFSPTWHHNVEKCPFHVR